TLAVARVASLVPERSCHPHGRRRVHRIRPRRRLPPASVLEEEVARFIAAETSRQPANSLARGSRAFGTPLPTGALRIRGRARHVIRHPAWRKLGSQVSSVASTCWGCSP